MLHLKSKAKFELISIGDQSPQFNALLTHCPTWKHTILTKVNELSRQSPLQTVVPLSHAQFLTKENIAEIVNPTQEWLVSPFYDRDRFLLLLFTHNGKNRAALIRRDKQIVMVRAHVPVSLFSGTLLDGQLAPGHGVYAVNDVLAISGRTVVDNNYVSRMQSLPLLSPTAKEEEEKIKQIEEKKKPLIASTEGYSSLLRIQPRPYWHRNPTEIPRSLFGRNEDRIYTMNQINWRAGRSALTFKYQTHPTLDFGLGLGKDAKTLTLGVQAESVEPNKRGLVAVVVDLPFTDLLLRVCMCRDVESLVEKIRESPTTIILECSYQAAVATITTANFSFSSPTLSPLNWLPVRVRNDRLRANRLSTWNRFLKHLESRHVIDKFIDMEYK